MQPHKAGLNNNIARPHPSLLSLLCLFAWRSQTDTARARMRCESAFRSCVINHRANASPPQVQSNRSAVSPIEIQRTVFTWCHCQCAVNDKVTLGPPTIMHQTKWECVWMIGWWMVCLIGPFTISLATWLIEWLIKEGWFMSKGWTACAFESTDWLIDCWLDLSNEWSNDCLHSVRDRAQTSRHGERTARGLQ